MKLFLKVLPWLFVALFASEIIAVMAPKKDGEFHVREFARLPTLLNGRIQPVDSVARNSLLQIRSTGDLPLKIVPAWQFWHHPKKLKATEWLLELATRPEVADTRPVFLIHHAELLGELKLQDQGIEKSGLRYYAYSQLKPVLGEIGDQAGKAEAVKAEDQTTFQKQVLKLANAVTLYQRLKNTLQPEGVDDFQAELAQYQKDLGPARAAAQAAADGTLDKEAVRKVAGPIQEFRAMAEMGYARIVPPDSASLATIGRRRERVCLKPPGSIPPCCNSPPWLPRTARARPMRSTAPSTITAPGWPRTLPTSYAKGPPNSILTM